MIYPTLAIDFGRFWHSMAPWNSGYRVLTDATVWPFLSPWHANHTQKVPSPKWTNAIHSNLNSPLWNKTMLVTGWWLTYASEKHESQLGWWHSQYMESHKIHVPNHQSNDIWILQLTTIWIWAWIKRRTHMNTFNFLHVLYWTEPPASVFFSLFQKNNSGETKKHPTRWCILHSVFPILLKIQSTKKTTTHTQLRNAKENQTSTLSLSNSYRS